MDSVSPGEVFLHIRVLLGTVVGLGLARLIMIIAGLIQHPRRARSSLLHMLWVGSVMIELVLFWWWQISLFHLASWTFGMTAFMVVYAVLLVLIATILAPDNIAEYNGYEDFFLQRRRWFFGLFAMVAVFDLIDNSLKGGAYLERFGPTYYLQAPIGITACLIACYTANRKVHLSIIAVHFAHQLYLISRYFNG